MEQYSPQCRMTVCRVDLYSESPSNATDEGIESGELMRILPDYWRPAEVWAVSTARSSASAKVRVAVDFLRNQLSAGSFALRRLS